MKKLIISFFLTIGILLSTSSSGVAGTEQYTATITGTATENWTAHEEQVHQQMVHISDGTTEKWMLFISSTKNYNIILRNTRGRATSTLHIEEEYFDQQRFKHIWRRIHSLNCDADVWKDCKVSLSTVLRGDRAYRWEMITRNYDNGVAEAKVVTTSTRPASTTHRKTCTVSGSVLTNQEDPTQVNRCSIYIGPSNGGSISNRSFSVSNNNSSVTTVFADTNGTTTTSSSSKLKVSARGPAGPGASITCEEICMNCGVVRCIGRASRGNPKYTGFIKKGSGSWYSMGLPTNGPWNYKTGCRNESERIYFKVKDSSGEWSNVSSASCGFEPF